MTCYVIETQPQNGLSLLVNAGDAFGHSRALHRGAVGRCWEATSSGAAATRRVRREWSVVRAARVFGALVVEAC